MLDWINDRWVRVGATRPSLDTAALERRSLPIALALGAVVGALLAFLSSLLGALVLLAGGFGIGYATRSYVSHRRRMDYIRQRGAL